MRGEAFGPPCSRSWSRFEKLTIEAGGAFVPVTFLRPVDKARMIGEQAGRFLISRSE
jgi:hypothetical protein